MNLYIYQTNTPTAKVLISEFPVKTQSYSLAATLPQVALAAYLQSLRNLELITVKTESLYNDLEEIIFSFANHGFMD